MDAKTLFCLVQGESAENTFPVTISHNLTIGQLQEAIKEKQASNLATVDSIDLSLRAVSVEIAYGTVRPDFKNSTEWPHLKMQSEFLCLKANQKRKLLTG